MITRLGMKLPDLDKLITERVEFLKAIDPNADKAGIEIDMFIQHWPNTLGGIDINNNICGQAFVSTYTTILHDIDTNIWFIYFGDNFAYYCHNPNERFFEDKKNHKLLSQKAAYMGALYEC